MMLINISLAGLTLIAVISDLKARRIPNWLVLTGMVLALVYYGYLQGYAGLIFSLKGLASGIGLLIIPFMMGGMGAGDVKLLGMVGALKGSLFVFNTFLWMALWGGAIALVLLINQGRLKESLLRIGRGLLLSRLGVTKLSDHLRKDELNVYFPYGVAIGMGVWTSFFKGWC